MIDSLTSKGTDHERIGYSNAHKFADNPRNYISVGLCVCGVDKQFKGSESQ